jgi:hypothetical protein
VLTDGEVGNAPDILAAVRSHPRTDHIVALGIGAETDAGAVEGPARETGRRAAFVCDSDNIADQLIPQLACSLEPVITHVAVELGSVARAELTPFPIPALSRGIATTLYASVVGEPADVSAVLVSGELCWNAAGVYRACAPGGAFSRFTGGSFCIQSDPRARNRIPS